MERLLTAEDLAEGVGVPVRTLADWRCRGVGPAYVRVGRHVRYRPADVEEWLATRVATSPADAASA